MGHGGTSQQGWEHAYPSPTPQEGSGRGGEPDPALLPRQRARLDPAERTAPVPLPRSPAPPSEEIWGFLHAVSRLQRCVNGIRWEAETQTWRSCSASTAPARVTPAGFAEPAFKLIFLPEAFGKVKLRDGRGLCHLLAPRRNPAGSRRGLAAGSRPRIRHRIPAWWGLAGTSGGHPAQPPAQAGSPRAGCTAPRPGGAGISPEKETPQPPTRSGLGAGGLGAAVATSKLPLPSSSFAPSRRTSHLMPGRPDVETNIFIFILYAIASPSLEYVSREPAALGSPHASRDELTPRFTTAPATHPAIPRDARCNAELRGPSRCTAT